LSEFRKHVGEPKDDSGKMLKISFVDDNNDYLIDLREPLIRIQKLFNMMAQISIGKTPILVI
jgi:hypothetical protein